MYEIFVRKRRNLQGLRENVENFLNLNAIPRWRRCKYLAAVCFSPENTKHDWKLKEKRGRNGRVRLKDVYGMYRGCSPRDRSILGLLQPPQPEASFPPWSMSR